jgi:hypothetical protein
VNGIAIESYHGLFARGSWIFQVIAFTGRERFPTIEGDLRGIVDSFEPPRD